MKWKVYRIRDWEGTFERSDLKKTKQWSWVAVPNKHDGKGYRRVTSLSDAVDVFCAWNLIYQVASKTPLRGTLADFDGPLSADDLSAKTGFPSRIFTAAFAALTDHEIGIKWLELVEIEHIRRHPDISGCPDVSGSLGTTGQDRTGQDQTVAPAAQASAEPAAKAANSTAPADCRFPVFPTTAGKRTDAKSWSLPEKLVVEWVEAFPAIDVRAECRRAHGWIKANLGRRKTASGMPDFLFRWLAKEQNSSSRGANGSGATETPEQYARRLTTANRS